MVCGFLSFVKSILSHGVEYIGWIAFYWLCILPEDQAQGSTGGKFTWLYLYLLFSIQILILPSGFSIPTVVVVVRRPVAPVLNLVGITPFILQGCRPLREWKGYGLM